MTEQATAPKVWTRDEINQLLLSNDLAAERAIIRLFERQTEHEQSTESTELNNAVGFSAFHARTGTYLAKYLQSGKNRHLTGEWLAKGRKIALIHSKQLVEIANDQGR